MTQEERGDLLDARAFVNMSALSEAKLLFSPWVALVATFGVLWVILTFLATIALGWNISWTGPWAPQIAMIGLTICTGIVALKLYRQLRLNKSRLQTIESDLANSVVEELSMHIVASKRFQEPEHGGLIYFLHTSEGEVFVQYDNESQDLGAQGSDPMDSSYRVKSSLVLVRAPNSRMVLTESYSGQNLEALPPHPLTASPNLWPVSEEFCETEWQHLEAVYAR